MPTKYQFGGLGHLFVCPCGCSEFIRAEGVKPERIEVYECVNCHEWYTPNKACTRQVESFATQSDSTPEDLPAPEVLSQPATCG